MVIKDVSSLIKRTAFITSLPEEEIKKIINHYFLDFKSWMIHPDVPEFYFPYLGKVYSTRNNVEHAIKKLIGTIRNAPQEEQIILKERLSSLWKYRRMVIERNKLKQFKTRFGTWHWKKKSN